MVYLVALAVLLALLFAHARRALPREVWLAGGGGLLLLLSLGGGVGFFSGLLLWILFLGGALVMLTPAWRMRWLSAPLLARIRKTLPPVSATEREAIDAGTVWWDAQLFRGDPDFGQLLATPPAALTAAERAYLDGPVEELCAMLDDWEITENRDLPPAVWDFLKEKKFFAINIPQRYGGLGFSPAANSAVVLKVCSRSSSAGVTVMVPNSLGPAELLLHYGTEEQKNHHLPRLASGRDIPCFALTGPWAGSDAASMTDSGVLTEVERGGAKVLGFKVTCDKRYITLAPVATVIGLAFRAHDPDGLLGGGDPDLGITCALVPHNAPGLSLGARHRPLSAVFMNGPIRGDEVFVPLDWIIGGRDGIGKGWRMLMESLAAGRAISLPASGVAMAKLACAASGAYARVRRQFNLPIGKFEGVEEVLARMGGTTYAMDAARRLTLAALLQGEKPSVISAMVKFHLTEGGRRVVCDAMDIHGGRGICAGPANYLAAAYQQLPIAITVEGANILTRSLIIFGQGAMRCHPFLLREMAAADGDGDDALREFDRVLCQHLGYTAGNAVRALVRAVGGGFTVKVPPTAGPGERGHYRRVARWCAAFALLADVSLLLLGGALKRREKIAGRFADALGHLYLCSAALKIFHEDGAPEEDRPLLDWACRHSLAEAETALRDVLQNFPSRAAAMALRLVAAPFGFRPSPPADATGAKIAALMTTPGPARERLVNGIYRSTDAADVTGRLEHALTAVLQAEKTEKRLRKEGRTQPLGVAHATWVKSLTEEGALSAEEAAQLTAARAATFAAISVDEFDPAAG